MKSHRHYYSGGTSGGPGAQGPTGPALSRRNKLTPLLGFIAFMLLGFAAVAFILYGCWQLERKWNYSFSYKSMVEKTVREMVKPEALR